MHQLFRIAVLDEMPAGKPLSVTVNGISLIVCQVEGRWHAVSGFCTHRKWPLRADGLVSGCLLCPLHGALFDPATGAAARHPARTPLACFPVVVRNGGLFVELSSGATTPEPPAETRVTERSK
jgi:3-phenylpropionate/trans-cinnamate dioxygenase ferredoxin subunit